MGKTRRRSFARKKEDHNDLFHRAGKLFVSSDRFFCRKKCREKSVFCSGLLLYIFPLYAHRKGAFIQNHQQDRFLQTGKIFLFHICNAGSCFLYSQPYTVEKCRIFKAMSGSCTGTVCCPDHSFWRRYLLSGGKTDANSGKKLIFPAVCKFRCNFYQLVGSCFERKFFMYQSLLFKDCLRYLGIVIFYVMNAVFEILSGMIIQDSGWEYFFSFIAFIGNNWKSTGQRIKNPIINKLLLQHIVPMII